MTNGLPGIRKTSLPKHSSLSVQCWVDNGLVRGDARGADLREVQVVGS